MFIKKLFPLHFADESLYAAFDCNSFPLWNDVLHVWMIWKQETFILCDKYDEKSHFTLSVYFI